MPITNDAAQALQLAYDAALQYVASLDERSVASTVPLEELRRRFCIPLNDEGIRAAGVVAELVRDAEGGLLGTAGGRFFGWVIGGGVPSAVAADWLVTAWDQNAALYAFSPV